MEDLQETGNVPFLDLCGPYVHFFTLQEFFKRYTYDMCTFLYVSYTLLHKKIDPTLNFTVPFL